MILDKSSSFQKVTIVREDVDLLVLLNGLASSVNNVYFQKSSKGESDSLFSSTSFNHGELSFTPGLVLFVHAFSACDTTSALFWHGKIKMLDVLQKHPWLIDVATIFLQPEVTHEEIGSAGNKLLVALYGGGVTSTLHTLRYEIFVRSAASAKIHLARLPPTEEAAAQHAYRTYHQVQKWLGVDKDPTKWGWTSNQQELFPVACVKDPAPQTLLQFISCKCRKGCTGRGCTCQKAGLKCSVICYFCRGKSCQNITTIEIDDSDNEEYIKTLEMFSQQELSQQNDQPGPSKKCKI